MLCWHLVKAVLLSCPQELPASKAMFSECSSDLQIRGHSRTVNRGYESQACRISTGLSDFISHRQTPLTVTTVAQTTDTVKGSFLPALSDSMSLLWLSYSQAGRLDYVAQEKMGPM